MSIKTVNLGLPENLERLDFLVGKLTGKHVVWLKGMNVVRLAKGWDRQEIGDNYSPTTNAQQCLDATPLMDISVAGRDINGKTRWLACHYYSHLKNPQEGDTELIARCLALVYSVYGDEVPESEWE